MRVNIGLYMAVTIEETKIIYLVFSTVNFKHRNCFFSVNLVSRRTSSGTLCLVDILSY